MLVSDDPDLTANVTAAACYVVIARMPASADAGPAPEDYLNQYQGENYMLNPQERRAGSRSPRPDHVDSTLDLV